MATLEDIRAAVPWAKDYTDDELVQHVAKITNQPLDVAAEELGVFPKRRGVGATLNDTAIEFVNAAAGGVKAGADFISPGNRFSQYLGEKIEEGEQSQSYPIQRAKRQLGEALQTDELGQQAEGVWQYLKQNPGLATAQAAGSFVAPGAAIKGARGAATLLGLGKKGVDRAGLGAGSVSSGMLSGGDAAGNAYDLVMGSQELAHLPYEERHLLATDAARKASIAPGVFGAATGFIGAEGALARNASRGILRTTGVEAGSEFIDEGLTQYSARRAASEYDTTINPMEGVAGSALLGGALGGITGAGVGLATRSPAEIRRPLVDPSNPGQEAHLLGARGGGQHPVVPGQADIDKAFTNSQLPLFQAETQPDLFPGTLVNPDGSFRMPQDALAPPPGASPPAEEQANPRQQLITEVRQAFEQALVQTGVQNANKGQVTRTVNSMLNGVNTKEELAAKINGEIAALQSTKRPNDMARAETLSNWRDNLMGVSEQQRLPLADQTLNTTNTASSQQAVQTQATQAQPVVTSAPSDQSEEVSPLQATAMELIEAVSQKQGKYGQRNKEMMLALANGWTQQDGFPIATVAKEFGVSEDRVKQVRKDYEVRMKAEAARRGITPEAIAAKRQVLTNETTVADEIEGSPTAKGGAAQGADALAGNRDGLEDADDIVFQAGTAMQERQGSSSVLTDVSEDHRAWTSLRAAKGDVTKVSDEDIQNLIADSLDEKKAKANKVENVLDFQKKLVAEAIRREKTRRAKRPDTDEVVDEEPTELSGDLTETKETQDEAAVPAEEVEQESPAPERKAGKQRAPVERQAVPAEGPKQKPARFLRKAGAAPAAADAKPSQEGSGEKSSAPTRASSVAEGSPSRPEQSTKPKSQLELAGEAWDKNRAADHPRWSELTAAQQKTFADYGPENWDKSDVATEAARIKGAATPSTDEIPPLYFSRTEVETRVFDEESGAFVQDVVKADEAIKSIKQDINTFQLLLKCVKGG